MRVAWDGSILGVSWAEALAAVAALLTPFAILFLTGLVHRRSQRLEEQQRQEQERLEADRWRSQELVKARLDRYNKLAGPLNSIFCYFTFIGRWKALRPEINPIPPARLLTTAVVTASAISPCPFDSPPEFIRPARPI